MVTWQHGDIMVSCQAGVLHGGMVSCQAGVLHGGTISQGDKVGKSEASQKAGKLELTSQKLAKSCLFPAAESHQEVGSWWWTLTETATTC